MYPDTGSGEVAGAIQAKLTWYEAATPAALRVTVAVGLVEEVLEIVTCPDTVPVVVGRNATFSAAVWPGFRVTGKVIPDRLKPEPVTVAEFTVTADVPVEVRVIDCVAVVLRVTSPKLMLPVLRVSVGTAAFNCRAKVFVAPPALAVRVAVWVVVTAVMLAEKPMLVAPAATTTDAGMTTAVLLLESVTVDPPDGAAAVSVAVQVSDPEPVIDELEHERELSAGWLAVS